MYRPHQSSLPELPKLNSSIRQFGECGVSSDLAQQYRLYGDLQGIISDNRVGGLARLWGERREVWRSPWGNSYSSSDRLQNPFIHRGRKNKPLMEDFSLSITSRLSCLEDILCCAIQALLITVIQPRASVNLRSYPLPLFCPCRLVFHCSVSTLANIAWSLTYYLTHDNRGSPA